MAVARAQRRGEGRNRGVHVGALAGVLIALLAIGCCNASASPSWVDPGRAPQLAAFHSGAATTVATTKRSPFQHAATIASGAVVLALLAIVLQEVVDAGVPVARGR